MVFFVLIFKAMEVGSWETKPDSGVSGVCLGESIDLVGILFKVRVGRTVGRVRRVLVGLL